MSERLDFLGKQKIGNSCFYVIRKMKIRLVTVKKRTLTYQHASETDSKIGDRILSKVTLSLEI